ncbi:TPA: YhfX family PLP-dependent enzyme [Yersinia enterocolitica]|uniref:YhfX family PLP-dependent enzyme n=1 Tax=Yersinia enterocolitica TaxID=630 RepID=UPI0028143834|nr:YhfX family PLP-dependent enzyme [Yersinia enterocolitica]EKN6096359.1 YhfX family PLP-dependent enzyme [Yersinia enterocolitica]HDL6749649.1 YhfX family PLP-dependent enzyme [Yersinia enterocolitica]HDL7876112.1 YhfX family PLP-dependent enzyme [Yersinia enterocolitica]HDL7891191.1 YhfX family PLP-dependent enzyme [Yersinia enterocolitica]
MLLKALQKQNPALIDVALLLWKQGVIRPDSYVIDVDQVKQNASLLLETATRYGITLYLMSKQFGRNPLLCKLLLECGYQGIVAVDFKEARQLYQYNLPVAHVGHLVQIPSAMVDEVVSRQPEVITVYSIDKAREIAAAAVRQNKEQALLLKVCHHGDLVYPGQEAGFSLDELPTVIREIKTIPGIRLVGVTHFPCMLFDNEKGKTLPSPNLNTLIEAKSILEQQGIKVEQVNAPSATGVESLPQLAKWGVTHAEPGHSLTGTMPSNQQGNQPEHVAMLYLTEVSHCHQGKSYCYGGGYYRRGHLNNALVYDQQRHTAKVVSPANDSIDYTLALTEPFTIGSPVVMCFRTQIFVTRSDVVLVAGIQSGHPTLLGTFDSQGNTIPTSTGQEGL